MDRVFASHIIDKGLIPNTPLGPNLTRNNDPQTNKNGIIFFLPVLILLKSNCTDYHQSCSFNIRKQ